MGPLLILGLICFALLVRYWKAAIAVAMMLVVFEGALRKWAFPESATTLYFLKDITIIAAFVGFCLTKDKQWREYASYPMTIIKPILMANFVFDFMEIFNPLSPSLLLGLFGFKNYLLYALLVLMVPYIFTSHDQFRRYLIIYMVVMVPVTFLGLLQYLLPGDDWLNASIADPTLGWGAATFGSENYVRATGTFSYVAGYTVFSVAMFNLALAFVLGGEGRNYFERWVPYLLLAGSVLAMFTTGSRGGFAGTFLAAPITLILCGRAGLLSAGLVVRIIVAGGLMAGGVTLTAGKAVDAFQDRAFNSDSNFDRAIGPFTDIPAALDRAPIWGVGIGTTHSAAPALMGINYQEVWWLKEGQVFENETGRVAIELGCFGFILTYLLRVVFILIAINMTVRLKTQLYKALSASICAFHVSQLPYLVVNNPTCDAYFWFSVGLLIAMYRLDYPRIIRERASTLTQASPQLLWRRPKQA